MNLFKEALFSSIIPGSNRVWSIQGCVELSGNYGDETVVPILVSLAIARLASTGLLEIFPPRRTLWCVAQLSKR